MQTGTGTFGESAFITRNVALAAYTNTVIRLRFAYTVSGSYYPQTTSGIGWYFDTISFTNTSQLTATNPSATIVNGSINPNGKSSTAWFEYGTTTAYGSQSPTQIVGSGTFAIAFTTTLAGLLPNTVYHYRVVAINSDGTSQGLDRTFTTGNAPPVLLPLARTGNHFQFRIDGASGSYPLERSPDLQTWTSLGSVTIPPTGTLTYDDANATQSHYFYRLK